MNRLLRPATVALAVATVLAGVTTAEAERVRCRSRDYKYASCRVSGRITNVRVVDRHSDRPCIQNRSFGWRGNTLWVNDGCDADFEVDTHGSGSPGGPGWGGPGPGPGGPGWGGPGGGQWDNPPSWAQGSWRSNNRVDGRTQYLSISRNGQVSWSGSWSLSGRWTGNGVRFTDGTFVRISEDGRRRITVDHPRLGRIDFRTR